MSRIILFLKSLTLCKGMSNLLCNTCLNSTGKQVMLCL